ncbi:hypothetical protein BGX34_002436 [Mortierella sp. NVP85]|nr:hypothetical protein BGX34_002436 [Mortierella sp. NVP85]
MSLDDCVAALPRVERGIPRDIFSPIPDYPEPYSVDLTQEYARFANLPDDQVPESPSAPKHQHQPLQHKLLKDSRGTVTRTGQGPAPGSGSRVGAAGGDTPNERFNCTACKKSFNSEATWNNHQMSAKHIAAVKEAEKKNKGGSKGNNNSRTTQQQKNQSAERTAEKEGQDDPPEVTSALSSFRKVTKVIHENPGMAASVMWKITKELWSFRQSREAANVLLILIRTLSDLQAAATTAPGTAPSEAGSRPSSTAQGSLTPTQISMTLYLSRLAMARLVAYRAPGIAQEYYLDAILGRWQIDFVAFQSICEIVNTGTASQLLDRCKRFLETHPKTEKLMSTANNDTNVGGTVNATKKPADPNLKLLTILLESAHMPMAAQSCGTFAKTSATTNGAITKEARLQGETSLVLFAMAAALSEVDASHSGVVPDNNKMVSVVGILRSMSKVYKRLGMSFSAAACLLRAGELTLQQDVHLFDRPKDDPQVVLLLWDLFQALLLAMETGDFVRMQSATRLLNLCHPTITVYQDVQV